MLQSDIARGAVMNRALWASFAPTLVEIDRITAANIFFFLCYLSKRCRVAMQKLEQAEVMLT